MSDGRATAGPLGAGEGDAGFDAPVDVARLEAFAASLAPGEREALLGILADPLVPD